MNTLLILAVLCGALSGLGLYVFVIAIKKQDVSLSVQIAKLDAATRQNHARMALPTSERLDGIRALLGKRLVDWTVERGWTLKRYRQDLTVLDRSLEGFLASKALFALGGLVVGPVVISVFVVVLGTGNFVLPLWGAALAAVAAFFIPDAGLRREADTRRRDFRHSVGSFLDLVSMNLAGGRGVHEALKSAADVGSGWSIARIRDALAFARLQGLTPWAALGQLGEDMGVDELRDLAAALALVAEDGAKVRQSLSARATSLRRKELTEMEGKAGERSQSMLVAQLVLCFGFMVFLAYPAVIRIFGAS
ncbi:MAG: type II secretion system F family protein [Mycobacteriales bacterium]|jgi:tight adherence protein C